MVRAGARARTLALAALIAVAGGWSARPAHAENWHASGRIASMPAFAVQIDPATVSARDLAEIRRLGFSHVRFGVRPEVVRGHLPPQRYAQVIAQARQAGLHMLVTLYGGRYIWGDDGADGSSDASEAKFAAFASQFMLRNAGPDLSYEIWNEPDNKTFLHPSVPIARLLSSAGKICDALAQAGTAPLPSVYLFGLARLPGPANPVAEQSLSRLLTDPRLGCMKGLSIHPYRATPETLLRDYRQLGGRIRNSPRPGAQLIVSEWGYASYLPVRSEATQATLIARQVLAGVMAQVPMLGIYAWRDRGQARWDREANFGLLRIDGSEKPVIAMLRDLLGLLAGAKDAQWQQRQDSFVLSLRKDGAAHRIYWGPQGRSLLREALAQAGPEGCTVRALGATAGARPCAALLQDGTALADAGMLLASWPGGNAPP
ncbi:hypothetical protein CBM2592_A130085 [Cupriavidus taiwanensis]|nr:hypothetical protein CBM2588_A110086 [Cupriavidus taiwanensis]SOY44786.1 hypothetical protein CBM2592_A130085 [Cupriavidus taiwanensis]SOY80669.1 hypothetical protein CBM2591_A170048 [Cupriavidus taiwanensis]SOZ21572.1 hypothetical protein CBM2608_A150048 [Cupriavidus taiwanensis]SOZ52405.1 hypothetical protein CBM2617_A150048 [Cupriavidus taiwanensis]